MANCTIRLDGYDLRLWKIYCRIWDNRAKHDPLEMLGVSIRECSADEMKSLSDTMKRVEG